VLRRLERNPSSVREVRLLPKVQRRLINLVDTAHRANVPVREGDEATLRRLTGTFDHQGTAALAEPYRYRDLQDVLDEIDLAGPSLPFLVLDKIQDPHNLGALLRTAAAVGVRAVILPRHGAASVTPSVEKASAGATNDVSVSRAANLIQVLDRLRILRFWSVGLVPRGGQNIFTLDLPDRLALVLGGEAGLRRLVEQRCDIEATIPVRAAVDSLNASVAGAVALYELYRRAGTA
jgi:23S rRNA (guanosine2251-2'-O)-methyltransferase